MLKVDPGAPCARCERPGNWNGRNPVKGLCLSCYRCTQRNAKSPVVPGMREARLADTEKRLRNEIQLLRKTITDIRKEFGRRIRAIESHIPGIGRGHRSHLNRRKSSEMTDPLLDQIARGMAKQRFAKLSPIHQDAVRSLAEKIRVEQPD